MANVKISDLTGAASASGTQEFEVNDSGTSKKVTGSQLATFIEGEVSSSPTFTGQVSLDNGTNTAPSLTNTGDTNTGLYFPSDDTVGLAAGGGLKLSANASGIDVTGTVTADGLTVGGDAEITSTTPVLYFMESDTTDLNIRGVSSSGRFYLQTSSDDKATVKSRFQIDNATGDISFYEDTGSTPKFFWDASAESLGIGTTTLGNYDKELVINSLSSTAALRLAENNVNYFDIYHDGATNSGNIRLSGAGGIRFIQASTERMRIDSSGNLLVGATSLPANSTSTGIGIRGVGDLFVNRSGDAAGVFNRINNDGDVIRIQKDGSTVGSIGSVGGASVALNSQAGNGHLQQAGTTRFQWAATVFYPNVDNSYDLGTTNRRFDDIYATNGTIQTSDRNEKQDIEALSDAEQRVAVSCKGLLRKFRWKDAVAEKGDDARIHFGIIAQDLQDAFAAEGLDAGRYAMFISSTWTDEETGEERTRMGVRYPELLAFIIAAI